MAGADSNVAFWLQADIQPPEFEVCSYPNTGHSGQGWEGLKLTHNRLFAPLQTSSGGLTVARSTIEKFAELAARPDGLLDTAN